MKSLKAKGEIALLYAEDTTKKGTFCPGISNIIGK